MNVERGSFTPLAFGTHGGSSQLCTVVLKRLCRLQCESCGSEYSVVMSLLRARLSFS